MRLEGVERPRGGAALTGELLLVPGGRLGRGGVAGRRPDRLRGDGGGSVRRVIAGPSCDVLELDDGTLVPLVGDAIKSIDPERRRIEIDRHFLGLVDLRIDVFTLFPGWFGWFAEQRHVAQRDGPRAHASRPSTCAPPPRWAPARSTTPPTAAAPAW